MKTKVRLLCTMSCWNHLSRPKKKLSCFWKSAMWKSFYHLPIRLSQMCMRIYIFCFKKHTHTRTKLSLANLFVQMQVFFHQKKKKDRAFCFSTKKVLVQQFFKCKIYFKNSNKLIIFFFFFFFVATQVKIFFVTYISGNKSIIFVAQWCRFGVFNGNYFIHTRV